MPSDFTLSVSAPTEQVCGLTEDDLGYIESRIIHTRYERTVTEGLSLSASRIYEAGRTIITAVRALSQRLIIKNVTFVGSLDDQVMHCWITPKELKTTKYGSVIRNNTGYLNTLDEQGLIIEISYWNLVTENSPKFTVTVYTKENPEGFSYDYPVGPTGILAYDMTFPAPSTFIHNVIVDIEKLCD